DADRPLLARFQEAGQQLLTVEPLARAVLLHHHVRDLVDPFVAGEALAAAEALAPAANHLALLRLPRVDDLVPEVAAVRAFHAVAPCGPATRRMPLTFNPSSAANSRPRSSAGPIENRCSTIAAPTAASSGAL